MSDCVEEFEGVKYLSDEHLTDLRLINGSLCGLYRFLFTHAVLVGLSDNALDWYSVRFCFDSYVEAKGFIDEWDGETIPEIGGVEGVRAIK